ncbi:hypothetical protein C0992_001140, partial [Termitomyces sp. T32_za158]
QQETEGIPDELTQSTVPRSTGIQNAVPGSTETVPQGPELSNVTSVSSHGAKKAVSLTSEPISSSNLPISYVNLPEAISPQNSPEKVLSLEVNLHVSN